MVRQAHHERRLAHLFSLSVVPIIGMRDSERSSVVTPVTIDKILRTDDCSSAKWVTARNKETEEKEEREDKAEVLTAISQGMRSLCQLLISG